MSEYLSRLVDADRQAECARHDAADADFDCRLHRIVARGSSDPHAEGEGRQCADSAASSKAAILGLWPLMRDAVRRLSVSDWLAVAVVITAVMATWSKP